jgi:Methyltransferase domain
MPIGSPSNFQKLLDRNSAGGGLSPESLSVWHLLMSEQSKLNIVGNFLELGVWHGIGLSAMGIHAAENEDVFGLDLYIQQDIVRQNFETLTNRKFSSIKFIEKASSVVHKTGALAGSYGSFRWVHIDGEHSFDAVCDDMKLAMLLLREDGIISVDDFFNIGSACVTHAIFWMLDRYPDQIRMFIAGGNKAYLASPKYYDIYRSVCRERLGLVANDQFGINLALARNGHGREIDYLTFFPSSPEVKAMKIGQFLDHVPIDL